jgi:hypothetical protein
MDNHNEPSETDALCESNTSSYETVNSNAVPLKEVYHLAGGFGKY